MDYAIVQFDSMGLNAGGHFQLSTNVFICPEHGIYGFSFSLYNTPGAGVACSVRKEEDGIVHVWSDHVENLYNAASNFGTVECFKGERVYVEVGTTNNSAIHGHPRVSFSGFLIHRYD